MQAAALEAGAAAAVTTNHHALGGAGAVELAEAVVKACSQPSDFEFLYDANLPIKVCICTALLCCAALTVLDVLGFVLSWAGSQSAVLHCIV